MFDPQPDGMFSTNPAEAKRINPEGWGIFATVNTLRGPRRICNLVSIDYWAIDIDAGTKAEQIRRINRGLEPTSIVETKRGFQCYWRAREAKKENWNSVMLERLVPYYGADANARDLARVLRAPGFLHMKNPAEPFMVREIYRSERSYTEAQMLAFYPARRKKEQKRVPIGPITVDEKMRAEHAEKYIAHMSAAISGQEGHLQTFKVALVLVKGFALPDSIALGLLRDYNRRCQPNWSEKELEHKIRSAAASRQIPEGYIVARST